MIWSKKEIEQLDRRICWNDRNVIYKVKKNMNRASATLLLHYSFSFSNRFCLFAAIAPRTRFLTR